MRANPQILQEVLNMPDDDIVFADDATFMEALEQSGFLARWEVRIEARTEEKKGLKFAKKLLDKGFSVEDVAELAELDIEKVKAVQAR
jgi:predicted transposase YdaD